MYTTFYGKALVTMAAFGLIVRSACLEAQTVHNAPSRTATFPAGTVFVATDPLHGRTYFATENFLQEQGTNHRYDLEGLQDPPESMDFSADGKRLILRTAYHTSLLKTADLDYVEAPYSFHMWWEGSRLGYLDTKHNYIHTRGHKIKSAWGRNDIIASDHTGRYFLGNYLVQERHNDNPLYQFRLWEVTKRGRLRRVRKLVNVAYDPASAGDPRHLCVLNKEVVVFGVSQAAIAQDVISVARKRHVLAPLTVSGDKPLLSIAGPLNAGPSIIGLAEARSPSLEPTGKNYFYKVTSNHIFVRRVASNVVFVTYDAKRHAIGRGIAEKGRVVVTYDKEK